MPQLNERKDLTGKRFGRLTALKSTDVFGQSRRRPAWLCKCDCGNEKIVVTEHLTTGHTQSCGCLAREKFRTTFTKHGLSYTPEYYVWKAMIARCLDGDHPNYDSYGGRGITVYLPWVMDFMEFYKDLGPRPSDQHSLDRINNDGGYYPDNCRWTTRDVQLANRRRRFDILPFEDVQEIRRLYATGKYTQSELGERYGLGQTGVSNIVLFKTRMAA